MQNQSTQGGQRVWPGRPYPLGATWSSEGTNFVLYSEVAEAVELCLFDDQGQETRIALPERTGFRWHGSLPDIPAGQLYGYRVHGPYRPDQGDRCNPAKLLIDPYAKAVHGSVSPDSAILGYKVGSSDQDLTADATDSAPFVPRSVVVDGVFDWEGDEPLGIPWHESVLYEVHVKGFTATHPEVPADLRGSYEGFAHGAAIRHLSELGITAVELLPVLQFCDPDLERRGLSNYWGYNPIAWLAPHNAYAASHHRGGQVLEFKRMVKALHRAGIEVILDVVFNHSAEGNHLGPTLGLRGIDNRAYYSLVADQPRYYMDYVGVGNTLNVRNPNALQLIMDSLRYWVQEMHVDGFRFDAAAALARELHEVDRLAPFFDLIQQDPVISQVKLIAEPWDLGQRGYQIGNFPPLWSEWNGRYRDTVRDFWRGADRTLADLAYRLTGSSDLYEGAGRRPCASINFITSHDGFTLEDLVSYNAKHNEPNGEGNRDGSDDNRSWNCGLEGPSNDSPVLALRAQQKHNLIATLLLSQGIPMLLGGDEMGRSQRGNNNAYCQDNEISWFDWERRDEKLIDFTRRLISFRQQHPVFRRHRWFQGRSIPGSEPADIAWFRPDAQPMSDRDWQAGFAKALQVFLNGEHGGEPGSHGEPVTDATFLILLNADAAEVAFKLPPVDWGNRWKVVVDASRGLMESGHTYLAGDSLQLIGRSLLLLQLVGELVE